MKPFVVFADQFGVGWYCCWFFTQTITSIQPFSALYSDWWYQHHRDTIENKQWHVYTQICSWRCLGTSNREPFVFTSILAFADYATISCINRYSGTFDKVNTALHFCWPFCVSSMVAQSVFGRGSVSSLIANVQESLWIICLSAYVCRWRKAKGMPTVQGKVPELKQWQVVWAKRASNWKPQAKFVPSDSPRERPCFNSGTFCLVQIGLRAIRRFFGGVMPLAGNGNPSFSHFYGHCDDWMNFLAVAKIHKESRAFFQDFYPLGFCNPKWHDQKFRKEVFLDTLPKV